MPAWLDSSGHLINAAGDRIIRPPAAFQGRGDEGKGKSGKGNREEAVCGGGGEQWHALDVASRDVPVFIGEWLRLSASMASAIGGCKLAKWLARRR